MISVVHDYSILYSNRILQKDKRWSDGRLRFYEVNNKMEVYSDEQSLVASDFYPSARKSPLESGAFEEGKEFQLPSGKLVLSIESYLGCSMRDLSKVFKRPSERQPVANPHAVSVKDEPSIKMELEDSGFAGSDVLQDLMSLKPEPRENVVREPPKQPKPRRIGLTRGRSGAKKQSDLSLFVRRPTVKSRLQDYVGIKPLTITRIPPRSSNLYTRLHKELALNEEPEAGHAVKVLNTGLTQSKLEDVPWSP